MLLKIAIIVVAAGFIYWILRMKKNKIFYRYQPVQPVSISIEGLELQIWLDFDTPLECLQLDGSYIGPQISL